MALCCSCPNGSNCLERCLSSEWARTSQLLLTFSKLLDQNNRNSWRRLYLFLLLLAALLSMTSNTCRSFGTWHSTKPCVFTPLKGRLQKLVDICNLPIVQHVQQGSAVERCGWTLQSFRRSPSKANNVPALSSPERIIDSGSSTLLIVALLLLIFFFLGIHPPSPWALHAHHLMMQTRSE
jgi:hypothetical protein